MGGGGQAMGGGGGGGGDPCVRVTVVVCGGVASGRVVAGRLGLRGGGDALPLVAGDLHVGALALDACPEEVRTRCGEVRRRRRVRGAPFAWLSLPSV
mgnify:CR=1 FL=1